MAMRTWCGRRVGDDVWGVSERPCDGPSRLQERAGGVWMVVCGRPELRGTGCR